MRPSRHSGIGGVRDKHNFERKTCFERGFLATKTPYENQSDTKHRIRDNLAHRAVIIFVQLNIFVNNEICRGQCTPPATIV